MIVVTGATGHLGRLIVEQLVGMMPAEDVGASVRDPGKATDLVALGVRVRGGDFNDAIALANAFEGADQILLVSSNARSYGGDPLAQHQMAIDVARASGARRIVYTSHMAAGDGSVFPPMRDHAATEIMLAKSGLRWTALRNGFYASSGAALLGDASKSGVVAAPRDGKVCWTVHEDLAEAAAIILLSDKGFDGPTPSLTAAQALDLDELTYLAAEVWQRPVERQQITEHELRSKFAGRGAPTAVADIAVAFFRASAAGEFRAIDPTLERLLGRSPVGMRQVLVEGSVNGI